MWVEHEQQYDRLVWQHQGERKTLKQVLQEDMDVSVRFLCGIKRNSSVLVNGIERKFHEMVENGQVIRIELPPEKNEYESEKIVIPILYEDADVIVVEKAPAIVVHPTKGHPNHTLLNGMIALFDEKEIFSKIRFINRLDRDTSGILLIAKNSYCHSVMSKENALHEMEKVYYAIIEGRLSEENGEINLPILKSEDGIRRIVDERGQSAVTRYEVLKTYPSAQLLRVCLMTGRTHQIRVHFSHIGHPLIGDALYGGNTDIFDRQALHCYRLGFYSPREEEYITVKTKLPQDMRELIDRLKA